jgi:hypothetical protein
MASGAIVARILSQYNGAGTKAAKKDLLALTKGFDRMAKKSAKAFGIAAAAGAAFAVKIGVDSVKAAIADEKSQALLANSLRNTTGANNEVIASVEKYIDQAQRALGITDDELRPAFAKLASLTGNVAHAQGLLGIAMDVSAGASVDMATATNAIIKATQGNFKALRGLGVKLDETTIKTKDVDAALKAAAKTFAGAASTRAETFEYRMKRVGIAFDEAKESLGIALMPTIESFFQLLTQKVIPAVQTFIEENGDKLVAAFQTAIKAIFGFAMVLYKTFDFVARNKDLFTALGIIFTATFVAGKVMAFVTAIQALVKAYQAIRASAVAAAGAQAAATGGLSVAAAAAGIAAFTLTIGGLYLAVNKANKVMDEAAENVDGLEFSFDGLDKTTTDFLSSLKGMNIDLKTGTSATAKLTAEQLKLVRTQASLAALKKLGVKPTTETDPLQLEAARLNLVKQGALAEQARVAQILASYEAQLKANETLQRYADLLLVVQDSKVSAEEVSVLAGKWGVSKEAVTVYIAAVYAVNDGKISTVEVDKLATQWGVTKEQAALYLDFFQALNDGKLDATEISKLQGQWGLTNAQVVEYAKQITAGVTPSALWPTPGNSARDSWVGALAALNAYIATIKAPIVLPTPVLDETAKTQAEADALIKARGSSPISGPYDPRVLYGAGVGRTASDGSKSYFNPEMLGMTSGGNIPKLGSGGIVTSPTIAMIGESGPEAVVPLGSGGFGGSITINVQGSVISEGDLVAQIRNAILQGQNSGLSITKSAVAI